MDDFELDQKPSQGKSKMSGGKANSSSSFQAQLEAARRADYIKKMLLGESFLSVSFIKCAFLFC